MDKSEFEKMVSGELYKSDAPDLFARRARAKRLAHEYNQTVGYTEDLSIRRQHLERLLGNVGDGCVIEPPFRVDYGENVFIGKNFYSNFDTVILDTQRVTIGDNVKFGPGVHLYPASHPLDVHTRCELGLEIGKPITIGSNVWVGGRVVILAGVTVGDGCVIGAGSVVTKSVPPFSLAVGNPCGVIRKLPQNGEALDPGRTA